MECKEFSVYLRSYLELDAAQAFMIAAPIIALILIGYLICKVSIHRSIVRENIVRENSAYYKAVLNLNEQTEYHHDIAKKGKLFYVLRVNSKAKFVKTDAIIALYDYLRLYGNEMIGYLQQVGDNRRIYNAYNSRFETLSSSITPEECETLKIRYDKFCQIEEKLVGAEKLDMIQEISITCYVVYTSPQGRNRYQKECTFLESEIRTAIRNIGERAQYMQTEAFRRKTERSKVTPSLRLQIIERDGRRCCICGRSARDGVILEVDHIVPVSKGGKTTYDNLQTLCRDCNRGKGSKTLE